MAIKELKEELEEKLNERYGDIKCVKCKYWSVRAKLSSDTPQDGPIIVGSCTKCDKNIIASDPYNGVPNWCPGYEVLGKTLRDRLIYDVEEETMDLKNVTEEVNEAMNVKIDPTNPDHYKNHTSLECIEEMEIIFGVNAVIGFCVCNAWKYIRRWKNKNGVEDLKKARWYVDRAQTLIYDNFVVAAWKEILIRMNNYIDKYIKESEE